MDENQCRTCLGEASDKRFTIDRRVNGVFVSEMLTILAQITVSKEDIFSNTLCKKCFIEISNAYTFRQKCQDTERTLRGFEKKIMIIKGIKLEKSPEKHTNKMEVEMYEVEGITDKQQFLNTEIDPSTDVNNIISYEIVENDDGNENIPYDDYEEVEYLEVDQTIEENCEVLTIKSERNGEAEFICNLCTNLSFKTDFGINRHLFLTHGKGSNPFYCQDCNIHFPLTHLDDEEPADWRIKEHLQRHLEGKRQSCSECFQVFKTLKQLQVHQHSFHLKFTDNDSSHKFSIFKASSEKSFQCYICDKIFNLGIEKKKHIQTDHQDKAGQDCPLCVRCKIPSALAYENHLKTHFSTPRFKCNFCERTFFESDRLQMHIKRDHEKTRFICFFCSKNFRDKSGIARHILGVHFNDRKFKCEMCSKAFTTSYNLKEHMFSIHKQASNVYTCESCSHQYLYRKQFERHRIHCVGVPEKRKR